MPRPRAGQGRGRSHRLHCKARGTEYKGRHRCQFRWKKGKGGTNPLQKDREAQGHQRASTKPGCAASIAATRRRGLNYRGTKTNQSLVHPN